VREGALTCARLRKFGQKKATTSKKWGKKPFPRIGKEKHCSGWRLSKGRGENIKSAQTPGGGRTDPSEAETSGKSPCGSEKKKKVVRKKGEKLRRRSRTTQKMLQRKSRERTRLAVVGGGKGYPREGSEGGNWERRCPFSSRGIEEPARGWFTHPYQKDQWERTLDVKKCSFVEGRTGEGGKTWVNLISGKPFIRIGK